jgi:hypothetical protein
MQSTVIHSPACCRFAATIHTAIRHRPPLVRRECYTPCVERLPRLLRRCRPALRLLAYHEIFRPQFSERALGTTALIASAALVAFSPPAPVPPSHPPTTARAAWAQAASPDVYPRVSLKRTRREDGRHYVQRMDDVPTQLPALSCVRDTAFAAIEAASAS